MDDARRYARYNRFFYATFFALAAGAAAWGLHLLRVEPRGPRLADGMADLRGPGGLGCLTFLHRRPSLLFLGDSQTYTGWDFGRVAHALDTADLGACAMGGLYAESLLAVLDRMAASGYRPRVVVYGALISQFVPKGSKRAQMRMHARVLAAAPHAAARIPGALRRRLFPSGKAARDAGLRDAQLARLSALDGGTVRARLDAAPPERFDPYGEGAPNIALDARSEELADAVCARFTALGSRVVVVAIPESPWILARYAPAVRARWRGVLERLGRCAQRVVAPQPAELGLDDRHFLTEQGLAAGWDDAAFRPEAFDFDPHHYNLAGADVFTRAMLPRLGLLPPESSKR